LHTSGDERGVTRELAAIAQLKNAIGPFDAKLDDFLRRDNFHAEALRLHHRATGQIAAAQSAGSRDSFRYANSNPLVRRSFAIDHHRLQSSDAP